MAERADQGPQRGTPPDDKATHVRWGISHTVFSLPKLKFNLA